MRVWLLGLATFFASAPGCGDPCTDMVGPGPIVQSAAQYEIDLYGAGVACEGARAVTGAPAPDEVHTYAANDKLTFQVPSGEHTIVLSAFNAANEPLGSACQRGTFGAAVHVCLSLVLSASPDLSLCESGACACDPTGDDVCPAGRYCAGSGVCEPGCRSNQDCMDAVDSDGGLTVTLPLCDTTRHACGACRTAADCVRAPACQDNVTVVYPPSGSPCVNGACVFPAPTVMSCPGGCYQGGCTAALAALDNVRAQQAGTQTPIDLAVALGPETGGGVAPSTRDVEVLAETRPRGAARALALTYFLNGNFGSPATAPMTRQGEVGTDGELWLGKLPKQPAGARVYFYVNAVGWDGSSKYAPGSQRNYTYGSN